MNFFQIVSLVSYSMILVFFEHYLLLMINNYFLTVIQTQLLVGSFQMLLKDSRSNCILLRENSKSIFFFDWPLLVQYWQILFHLPPNFSSKKSEDDLFHLIKNYMKFLNAVYVNIYIYILISYTHIYVYIYINLIYIIISFTIIYINHPKLTNLVLNVSRHKWRFSSNTETRT